MNTSSHLMKQDFMSSTKSQNRPFSRVSQVDPRMMTSGDQFNTTLGKEGSKQSNPASLKS